MANKKYKVKTEKKEVKEPVAHYGKEKPFRFFASFEEEEEFVAKKRAELTYDERMLNAEELRKKIFSQYVLPNGKWKPVERIFKIVKPYVNAVN